MLLYNKAIFKRCFCYSKRYWYKNLMQISRYFKEIHYLIKHGYDCTAVWDHFQWFLNCAREVLTTYKAKHYSFGIVDDSLTSEENEKLWEETIDHMIELLNKMDEDTYFNKDVLGCFTMQTPKNCDSSSPLGNYKTAYGEMQAAKNEFFELYSKYFYYLWD